LFLPREPRRERARTAATSHRCKSSGKRGNSTGDRRRGRKRKREKRVVAILLKYCRCHISKTKKHTGKGVPSERERGLVLFRILSVVAEGFAKISILRVEALQHDWGFKNPPKPSSGCWFT